MRGVDTTAKKSNEKDKNKKRRRIDEKGRQCLILC
jgi:hypothetical protein